MHLVLYIVALLESDVTVNLSLTFSSADRDGEMESET